MEMAEMNIEEPKSDKEKAYQDLWNQYEGKKAIALDLLDGILIKYGIDNYLNICDLIEEIGACVDEIDDLFYEAIESDVRPSRTEVDDARSCLRHSCEVLEDAPLHIPMTCEGDYDGVLKLQENILKTIWMPFIQASLRVGHFW